ncbi:hypothetical protein LTR66_017162 [Elasticomyces elasticus]|nr:hypothetical protein LTR66_017162 [Elasticomyces elasticus]
MAQHDCMQFCTASEADIQAAINDLIAIDSFFPENWELGFVEMFDSEEKRLVWVRFWKFRNSHGIYCICLEAKTMLALLDNEKQCADAVIYLETGVPPHRTSYYVEWLQMHIINFGATHILFNDVLAAKAISMLPNLDKVARVEIIHTLEQIPAGSCAGGIPGSSTSPLEFQLWLEIEGRVAVSEAVQKYAQEECKLPTVMLPNHAFSYLNNEPGQFPAVRRNFTKQTVVMVNPAVVKGFDMFLLMAQENHRRAKANKANKTRAANEQFPVYKFRCYLSWGTLPEMIRALRAAGVELIRAKGDFEKEFDNISVLVMPSLWCEAWGLIATECQLRGIPVMGANNGGIPESKCYAPPLLPVVPLDGNKRDDKGQYLIPQQDARPWIEELDRLLTKQDYYRTIRMMSFCAAHDFIEHFDYRGMEKFLQSVMKK